jgi:predicted DNA-binding transcriptional regulator YafY
MRADRLVAALLVLQARGRVTAEELAQELEVSARTVRRDLEGLAMAGIPVYSQPGRGGGWTLRLVRHFDGDGDGDPASAGGTASAGGDG